jgi:glycosyltransferase involved in cell wall biosynthesis
VYSYDQGYNALEAMAQGKVVFTGAEQEWLDHYSLEEDSVAINALPNTEKIVEKLEKLLLHPEKIEAISKNAIAFVKREHDHVLCAKRYTQLWNL